MMKERTNARKISKKAIIAVIIVIVITSIVIVVFPEITFSRATTNSSMTIAYLNGLYNVTIKTEIYNLGPFSIVYKYGQYILYVNGIRWPCDPSLGEVNIPGSINSGQKVTILIVYWTATSEQLSIAGIPSDLKGVSFRWSGSITVGCGLLTGDINFDETFTS